jgi:origin recognition complex subunit 5
MDQDLDTVTSAHPGYEAALSDLAFLLDCAPPPFVYIQDPNPRLAGLALAALLAHLSSSSPTFLHAQVDAIECFNARLFYDTVLNSLAKWEPQWQSGCANWAPPGMEGQRWNDSLDSFLHGLRTVQNSRTPRIGNLAEEDASTPMVVLVVEHAERVRESSLELMAPLTRLGELVSSPSSLQSNIYLKDVLTKVANPNYNHIRI